MGISFNPDISLNNVNFHSDGISNRRSVMFQTPPDTFVRETPEVRYARKLEELFPNGELQDIYNEMCEELELDYKPTLNFNFAMDKSMGAGYTFSTNSINLSPQDTLDNDIKIIGTKNGQKEVIVSKLLLPMIVDRLTAAVIVKNSENAAKLGYECLDTVSATKDDRRKLILLKLYHELIHAKQHMIMRQTEGIGSREVVKAWQHIPLNAIPVPVFNKLADGRLKSTYWADIPSKIIYDKNSPEGEYAYKCLDAVQNYPPVTSPEYEKNFIEMEAYLKSHEYITEKYGDWN